MDTFKFDLKAKRIRYSDERIIEGLKAFAATRGGGTFTMPEFEAWPGKTFGTSTVMTRFGSWQTAMARAGITGGRPREYRPEEMMERLEAVWRLIKRPPGHHQMKRHGNITAGPYKRHWGSLRTACERLAAFHEGKMTREEMLRQVPVHERKTRPKRKGIPVDVRWRVLKRDGHRCVCCGANPVTDPAVELQIDHIVPVSKGGGNEESNLRTLCRACNAGKKDRVEGGAGG